MNHDTLHHANLKLDLLTGAVYRRTDDDDWTLLGPIEDAWYCPPEEAQAWDHLGQEWNDRCRYGASCRATAESSYYAGLSPDQWR